jgi:hypothetical protein
VETHFQVLQEAKQTAQVSQKTEIYDAHTGLQHQTKRTTQGERQSQKVAGCGAQRMQWTI